jgi:cytochrome b6-f complex iron-sulfur subunit
MNKLSRRDFIKLSTNTLFGLGGVLGLAGLFRYFDYYPPETPVEFDLGDVANFPAGSRTVRSDVPAVIFNVDGKISALSLVCTHLGCTVAESSTGFDCPCHGSRYDETGNVLAGPAQKSLRTLRVEISKENTLKLYTKG